MLRATRPERSRNRGWGEYGRESEVVDSRAGSIHFTFTKNFLREVSPGRGEGADDQEKFTSSIVFGQRVPEPIYSDIDFCSYF